MLGIGELSNYLGVSPQSTYNRLSASTFPIKTKRIGRRLKWDRRDVDHCRVEAHVQLGGPGGAGR
jgi:predicted DNA-binding transcriptional regulator AlpA